MKLSLSIFVTLNRMGLTTSKVMTIVRTMTTTPWTWPPAGAASGQTTSAGEQLVERPPGTSPSSSCHQYDFFMTFQNHQLLDLVGSYSLAPGKTRWKTELIISFISHDYQQHMNIVSAIVIDHPNELTMGKRDWATLSKLRKSWSPPRLETSLPLSSRAWL